MEYFAGLDVSLRSWTICGVDAKALDFGYGFVSVKAFTHAIRRTRPEPV